MKGALSCVAVGCVLGATNAKVVKWGRDANQKSWTPPQETLGVMPELFNANLAPLPTQAPLVPKRALDILEKRGATDNTCAYVSGSIGESSFISEDTTRLTGSQSDPSTVTPRPTVPPTRSTPTSAAVTTRPARAAPSGRHVWR